MKIKVCRNLIERKKPPKVKKNVESTINTASAQAFHIKMKNIDTAADYSRSVGDRMNGSCINRTIDIFFLSMFFFFLPNFYKKMITFE